MAGPLNLIMQLLKKTDPAYEKAMDVAAARLNKIGTPLDPDEGRDFMWNALRMMESQNKASNPVMWQAIDPTTQKIRAMGLTTDRNGRVYLESLGAHPEGQGAGSELLKQIIKARGGRIVELQARPERMDFYRRHGFQESSGQMPDEDYYHMMLKKRGGLVSMRR